MRPVRFVALSEDGQALVLSDEVGRLLSLPLDDRVGSVLRSDGEAPRGPLAPSAELAPALSPRDIQARIRAGESAEDVARVANVPVDRVLRYAGPVLQERAMLAQHARRTRLRTSENGASLADVVDKRIVEHGVEADKVSWDAYRKEDGTWRIIACWPSGKAAAKAIWDLDKARQVVAPFDDMAQFLSAERPTQILGQEPAQALRRPSRDPVRDAGHSHGHEPASGHEPIRPSRDVAVAPSRDPLRRDALRAAMERPLGEPVRPRPAVASAGFGEERDQKELPDVPSLAVLRPRRTDGAASATAGGDGGSPRSRLPSWDDVLFGGPPASS